MSDLATLQHNNAFSPRNYNASTATAATPQLHCNNTHSSTTLSTNQPPSDQHPHPSSTPGPLTTQASGKRRTRRLSTPTEERKEQQRKKKKDNRAHYGSGSTSLHSGSNDDIQLHVTTDLDADDHQWLLASAAASQRAAAQLTAEAELCPLLIEPQQLIASSEDDMSPLLTASPAFPAARHRVVDLVSSYEQLSFIRFPPRLTSLAVSRYVWAAVGLMEVGWVRGHEGETGSATMWVNAVRGWQACWLVLCLCALGWSVAVEWAYDSFVPELDRVLLAVCWCVSVIAAVLLSHRILSHRLIGTRLHHLYHNAHPARSSLPAINRTLYSSLLGLLLLFAIGLYADLTGRSPASNEDVGMASAQSSLWYACISLLRLQVAAGASLAVCLLDVHRLRVEQSRAVLMDIEASSAESGDAICAHLLDVQLCVADLSDRVGAHAAVIMGASALSSLVLTLCSVTAGVSVQLFSLLSPLLLASYILLAAARLNQVRLDTASPRRPLRVHAVTLIMPYPRPTACVQACSRLHSAVAVVALQPASAAIGAPPVAVKSVSGAGSEGEDCSAIPPRPPSSSLVRSVGSSDSSVGASLRSFGWHRVSFDACGVRVDAGVACVFLLFWCGVLLWLMQTEHAR